MRTWSIGLAATLAWAHLMAAEASKPSPSLTAGSTFTVAFPEMPPTFYDLYEKKDVKTQMTVFLPSNYAHNRKYPLLIFLNGSDGGTGSNPGVARALTAEKDFVCVAMPLFKATDPKATGGDFIMRDRDAKYMWPFFGTMLAKLDERVPNIDPARRVLGGFSNGAHAVQGLIDESDGEVARRFSAFLFVEGGGRLRHYELLKGKPYLMVSSNAKSRPRAQQIFEAAKAAGARATLIFEDVGKHDFPVSAYPAVRAWLRGPAMDAAPAQSRKTDRASAAPSRVGDQQIALQVGDLKRTCLVHLPPSYDGKRPLPLVVALHGSGGNGAGMAKMTGFSDLADKEGFLVAYPDGLISKTRGWNSLFGKIPGGTGVLADEVDDVAFFRALLGRLHESYHTDPARVYVCGHSAGGYMSYRLAIELSDRIAASGIVNGSLGIKSLDGKPAAVSIPQPMAPISLIHICGAKDNAVKFGGAQTPKNLFKSVPDCIRHFVEADQCATPGRERKDTEHGIVRTFYSDGKAGTEVELVIVENCNHNWPTPQNGLSASRELWEFFSKHPKVKR